MMFFIQAIVPIIPYAILAGAAGIIYGKTTGFFMAWSSAMAGTLCIYLLAKYTGIKFIQRVTKKPYQLNFENMNGKTIFLLLLIIRVFPVVPTPVINIGSGLSGVPLGIFASSSALGMIPWAIIYVALGDYFHRSHNITNTLAILGAILIIIIIGISYFRKRINITANSKDK